MNISGPVLLVASAFLHALWNALIKKSENKNVSLFYIIFIATVFSVLISPWTGGLQWGSSKTLQYMFLAGAFEAGYFFALTKTLEGAPLGIGYAIMRGGAMIFVWLISTSFMGEQITPRGLVSIVLILLGITLANPKRGDKGFLKHGFTSAIVAAFFIAGKKVLDFKSNFSGSKKYLLLSAGIFSASSFILFLYGLVNSGPGVAISLRNTSVAFAQLFAFFLGEKLAMIQWFAFLCVLAGTAFLV